MIQTWQITTQEVVTVDFPKQESMDEITRQLPEGYYSTLRTHRQRTHVLGLKAHLERLYQPVRLPDIPEAVLREHLRIFLQDYADEARLRVIMTKHGQVYVAIEPLKLLAREIYQNGVRVETVEMARKTPRLKTTAFISASEDERKHIAREGIFEALMVKDGRILEGMTSNFFYVVRSTDEQSKPILGTAQHGILLGVTRQTVIEVARGRGLEVTYQPLKRDQLQVAREAFITSSSRGIVPVVQIDDVTVGEGRAGAITAQLSVAYDAYVLEKAEKI